MNEEGWKVGSRKVQESDVGRSKALSTINRQLPKSEVANKPSVYQRDSIAMIESSTQRWPQLFFDLKTNEIPNVET